MDSSTNFFINFCLGNIDTLWAKRRQRFARALHDARALSVMSPLMVRGFVALVVWLACARSTAASGVFGARGLGTSETTSTQRGEDVRQADASFTDHVEHMSPHALAADAADAAAEALHLPRSTGTRFSAESLSAPPQDDEVVVTKQRARPRVEPFASRTETETNSFDTRSPGTAVEQKSGTLLDLETYLGGGASDPPPDADPEAVAAAALAAEQFLAAEKEIMDAYEAAMNAWLVSEAQLDARVESIERDISSEERETRERGVGSEAKAARERERQWAQSYGVGEGEQFQDEDSVRSLEAFAKAACTQTIHHKPVYVPGVFQPPKHAPSVKIPGTPPVFIPGKPAFWEPGRAPFYTPGFWTPGKAPRFISAIRPVIVPAKHGTVIPGEFVPPAYTPGFVIPGWHETTACAVPVCVAPCQEAPVIPPEVLY